MVFQYRPRGRPGDHQKLVRELRAYSREAGSAATNLEKMGGGRLDLVLSNFIERIGPQESERLREARRRLARRSSKAKRRRPSRSARSFRAFPWLCLGLRC
jgi:hypothetical protein